MNSIELIEALVGQTDHDIKEFTGGAVIQTVINNKTIIKYKVSLYFGYENKKPLTRIIEIDKDVYFALPKALDDYLSNVVKRSDSKVFTMSRPTGRPTPNPTGTSTPTNTNTNTLNTKTINTNNAILRVTNRYFLLLPRFRFRFLRVVMIFYYFVNLLKRQIYLIMLHFFYL